MFERLILITDTSQPLFAEAQPGRKPDEDGPLSPHLPSLRSDYAQEWEDEKTITALAAAWRDLGLEVEVMPIEGDFLARFDHAVRKGSGRNMVHSIVEGWGTLARESWIPSLCELSGTPWIGSPAAALASCMDKDLVLRVAESLGVGTPIGTLITDTESYSRYIDRVGSAPHFIKPNAEGSGLGIDESSSRAERSPLPTQALTDLLARFPDGLRVEETIAGDDLTTGLVGAAEMLPIARIRVPGNIYGAEHKRKDAMTEEVDFPHLDAATTSYLNRASRLLWDRFGLADVARIDWKLRPNGQAVLLEINPLPGLSPYYSVLPAMWTHSSRDYRELLQTMLVSAAAKVGSRQLHYGTRAVRRSAL